MPSFYRPFMKQWLYFDRKLNDMVYRIPRLFPSAGVENRVIMVKQRWSGIGNLALLVDCVPDLQSDGGAQCFPMFVYDGAEDAETEVGETATPLFAEPRKSPGVARRDGITDAGLVHFQSAYPGETITKEDVFYYVYGILHSSDYRERYADNLGKELPRIPRVKTAADFWAFSKAGRALGDLHVGYEKVSEFAARLEAPPKPTAAQYRVDKMKFGKGKDKRVIHYNEFITVRDIPLDAYDYVVNGKPAVEWVMDRQSVTTDKASGIIKDANAWATETVGDPRYPLSLLLRVITVSLETMKIVRSLPALDILEESESAATTTTSNVVPFERVSPEPGERFKSAVPLMPLQVAAGSWSASTEHLPELEGGDAEWVSWKGAPKFTKGMFVAKVTGRSMQPVIPDGAYCLFRVASVPSTPDHPVLVRHGGTADPETGGQFTVKKYKTENGPDGTRRVLLEPANPEFSPIVVAPGDEVSIIAELVEVLGGAAS